MNKPLKHVHLERVTEAMRKQDTQPMHSVTGEMIISWNTPRVTPLPEPLADEDVTEKRVVVSPDDWLLLKAQEVLWNGDEWIR